MADWIEEGVAAPDFSLPSDKGEEISLKSLRGKPVVLYFYPKDDTPGCTKQACAFRDRSEEFRELGAVVLGVSGDDVDSHRKFAKKFDLNFPLLADEGFAVSEKYGAYREKNMYGKKVMGIQRSTFLVDGEGQVARVWKRVSVEGHDDQTLEALRKLSAAS
ncbi:MAG TPA: thioredoxin-dependent thiol peroxidase [Pirellulaceae bacterium]|jgi:peroxiredoxin Q/BCP|nr:thioredoxin-dependent thiol peroxidase [Pirellulaceae bacterium]